MGAPVTAGDGLFWVQVAASFPTGGVPVRPSARMAEEKESVRDDTRRRCAPGPLDVERA